MGGSARARPNPPRCCSTVCLAARCTIPPSPWQQGRAGWQGHIYWNVKHATPHQTDGSSSRSRAPHHHGAVIHMAAQRPAAHQGPIRPLLRFVLRREAAAPVQPPLFAAHSAVSAVHADLSAARCPAHSFRPSGCLPSQQRPHMETLRRPSRVGTLTIAANEEPRLTFFAQPPHGVDVGVADFLLPDHWW